MFVYRNSDGSGVDAEYNVSILRFKSIAEIPWGQLYESEGEGTRIIVQPSDDSLPLDFVFLPRNDGSGRLLAGLHGAEFRNENLPKFQFLRSFTNQRTESLIFLSDPTYLVNLGKVGIAWYSGIPGQDIWLEYAELLNSLASELGISQTVLVGHSAGASGAVKIGAQVENSRAIAVNGQFAADLYPAWAMNTLVQHAYPEGYDSARVLSEFPEKFYLSEDLNRRVDTSTVSWYSHADDGSSFNEFPNFDAIRNYFGIENPEGGRTSAGDVIVKGHWDAQPNAHALPGTNIPFIEATLGEKPSLDLKVAIQESLAW